MIAATAVMRRDNGIVTAGRRVVRSRSGRIGLSLLAIHLVVAIFAPVLAPFSPTEISPADAFARPGREHLFGTDQYGRDLFSRVLYGGRVAIVVALISTSVGVALGALLGLFIGVRRGAADEVVNRISDAIFAIPSLLMLLLLMTLFGSGLIVITAALAFFKIAPVARVVRGKALDLAGREFVTAATLRGESHLAIVRRELMPHAVDIVMVEFAVRCSWTVMGIAGLAYLGFGVRPPTPDWGLMIAENRSMMQLSPWGTLFPILAIASLVVGLNLTADALANALGVDRGAEVPA